MPAPPGSLWKFFYKSSAKQNQHHYKAYCYGCLNTHHPLTVNNEITPKNVLQFHEEDWFISGITLMLSEGSSLSLSAAYTTIGHLHGERSALRTHLLKCNNASVEGKAAAKQDRNLQKKQKADDSDADDESADGSTWPTKKQHLFVNIKKAMKQSELKVYQGIDIPFTDEQKEEIYRRFCRATISANLPCRWVEDPEIIKLLLVFRSRADSVIPSRKVLSGRLLDREYDRVQEELKEEMKGKYVSISSDGWKDNSKNSVTGVDASVNGTAYLIDVQNTTATFEEMIDRAERVYRCIPVDVVTDGDGGSQRGQDLLSTKRPWIFTPPCSSHQFQLILGDYFKESEIGATIAEQATDLTGWILGHQRVKSIFDRAQEFKNNGKVWAYLVANLTRWSTHSLSFNRLIILKPSLRYAVAIGEEEIVDTQVGVEKDRRKRDKLAKKAKDHCKIIDSAEFWTLLEQVADDIELICYGTNINQSDKTRPDQVVLTFTGMSLHFECHLDRTIATWMSKCIEKRWAAMDQPMYIFALILNPYEWTDRFGDKAGANVFMLNTDIIALWNRVKSHPPPNADTMTEEERDWAASKLAKEKEVSKAFLRYMQGTGVFAQWEKNKAQFEKTHGNNPILVWEQLRGTPETAELADFAVLLLEISANPAGNELDFSVFKIKKTRLWNRLGLGKLQRMSAIGASIRKEHVSNVLAESREKRQNHATE
ncbi:hypothetical protein ARMGADRAFT_1098847 [Armillaria gallica]|uniref:DUF659 domain-containing protein n=1 Tax=Armillaria gallica TaxID=47427 RepID=A0A2H3DK15_ARMGA|nr:hypothetical protein ARMGADRAFT_1098847 [Armillaria gallica]